MIEIGIHPDGRRPALIVDATLLPAIHAAAADALSAALQALPQPTPIDRQTEAHAQAAVEKHRLAVEEKAAAKRAALAGGDFPAMGKTELALERAQQEQTRATRLAVEIGHDLDARQAEAKVNHATSARAVRLQLAKDLDVKIQEALAAFLETAGEQLKRVLTVHHERRLLDAYLTADALAESALEGQQAARHSSPRKPDILPIPAQGFSLKCDKCHGALEVSGQQVRCGRCGQPHPITP